MFSNESLQTQKDGIARHYTVCDTYSFVNPQDISTKGILPIGTSLLL